MIAVEEASENLEEFRSRSTLSIYINRNTNFGVSLQDFIDYLSGPDGGAKKRKDAHQNAQQVYMLASAIKDVDGKKKLISMPFILNLKPYRNLTFQPKLWTTIWVLVSKITPPFGTSLMTT